MDINFHQFTSKNTFFTRRISKRNFQTAVNYAKRYSSKYHWPIMVELGHGQEFAKAENGVITESSNAIYF